MQYFLPAWGFLEEIRIRPRIELPNMDASAPYVLSIELLAPSGERVPFDVQIVARDVK